MNTALLSSNEKIEYFDNDEEIEIKLNQLAQWIKASNYMVAFTGAGISTAAGLADFRSGVNTVLDTGPGILERQAMGLKNYQAKSNVNIVQAIPTKSHMALAKLMEMGKLKYIISQNTDGLHIKSGVPHNKIAELLGNTNLERCTLCAKHYLRDYPARKSLDPPHDHKTGNICEDKLCRGELVDTIVTLNEHSDKKALQSISEEAAKADLLICIGSSMRSHCDIPLECLKNGGRVVIINLQKTPLDNLSSLIIHGKIEDVVPILVGKLAIDIPKWKLSYRLRFILTPSKDNKKVLEIKSIEKDGSVYTVFTKVIVNINGSRYVTNSEPFEFVDDFDHPFTVELHFQGLHGEPPLELTLSPSALYNKIYTIEYDLDKKKWDFNYVLNL
jgi:NAD-dependent SIR2 family protein deacetylase